METIFYTGIDDCPDDERWAPIHREWYMMHCRAYYTKKWVCVEWERYSHFKKWVCDVWPDTMGGNWFVTDGSGSKNIAKTFDNDFKLVIKRTSNSWSPDNVIIKGFKKGGAIIKPKVRKVK